MGENQTCKFEFYMNDGKPVIEADSPECREAVISVLEAEDIVVKVKVVEKDNKPRTA